MNTAPMNLTPLKVASRTCGLLPFWRASFAGVGVLLLMFIAGCVSEARIGGNTPTDEVIDELREDNAELRSEVDRMQQEIDRRVAQLDAVKPADDAAGKPPLDESIPQLAALRFDRYSGALDTNDDGRDDVVRIYLKTYDQNDRFLSVAGKAVVQLVSIEPNQAPALLAVKMWAPDAFAKTYRSSFTGTHYTLELSLPDALDKNLTSLTAKLSFTDSLTGVTLSRQAELVLKLK